MIIMKLIKSIAIFSIIFILTACQSNESQNLAEGVTEIVVGATAVPHADFLEVVKDDLMEKDIKLTVKEFGDYTLLNEALVNGDIDANFFQHIPFLESYNSDTGNNLIHIAGIHIEPMGAYSNKIDNINDLQQNSTIAIPSDPSNGGRALLLLQDNNIIDLSPDAGVNPTILEIIDNPLNINFIEMDAAQIARVLPDVDLAVINTNYALLTNLNPEVDSLIIEDGSSPFTNVVVVREGDENREDLQELVNALQSDTIRNYIKENYGDAVIPVF